jgi:hypothetical protein
MEQNFAVIFIFCTFVPNKTSLAKRKPFVENKCHRTAYLQIR